ncbi:centrosomal protein of 63 kDa isoform X2 [Bombina bombina]|uniref:centrosomal protein of 63 kDa isoform X2 n=1 Tax=Bombina bombina TaxID=8345 RepID=UPI00235A6D38|nr:centrosomal protein of 63 kDa isoform X2 [Bombina bombina]
MEALLESLQTQEKMGVLQGSCEAELQELMRQIDIMLAHKKSEWDAQTQILTTRLELRDQELSSAHEREERLNQEIRSLRKQLREQEEGNCVKTAEYETQLKRFQEELTKLKKSYERVQKRHLKLELKNRAEEEQCEISRLNRRLEEFRQRSLDWEKQRLLYQQQVASLEAQRRTLMEQAEVYQQSQSRKQMLEQTSLAGRSELQHITGQLLRTNDTLCAKEEETDRLKLQLEVAMGGQEQAEQEVVQARQAIQVLQEEKEELRATLQTHTDFLQGCKSQKEELQREVCRMSDTLIDKEESIRSLEERLQETRLSEGRTDKEEISFQLSVSLMNEKRLKAEVTHLEDRVGSVTVQCQQLASELNEKKDSLQRIEEEYKKSWNEIRKLKGQLSQAELTYNSAVDGMRKEISQLTQELHKRDMCMASSNTTAGEWEKKLRSERERAERQSAEHRVFLENLQQENRRLSAMLEKRDPDVLQALDNLECENQKLQKELTDTKRNLELFQQKRQSDIQTAVERISQELLLRHKQEIKQMQERLKEATENYQSQQGPCFTQKELSRSNSVDSLSSEVWKGVDLMSSEPIGREQNSSEESLVESVSLLPIPPTSPADAVASRFLQEEEIRSQELIHRLDSHIEELKQESQRTVQIFSQPR